MFPHLVVRVSVQRKNCCGVGWQSRGIAGTPPESGPRTATRSAPRPGKPQGASRQHGSHVRPGTGRGFCRALPTCVEMVGKDYSLGSATAGRRARLGRSASERVRTLLWRPAPASSFPARLRSHVAASGAKALEQPKCPPLSHGRCLGRGRQPHSHGLCCHHTTISGPSPASSRRRSGSRIACAGRVASAPNLLRCNRPAAVIRIDRKTSLNYTAVRDLHSHSSLRHVHIVFMSLYLFPI